MTDIVRQRMSETVETAIRQLVSAEHFRAGSFVTMPVIYPSGASVVLEVFRQGERFLVSDRGGGHQEAEFAGTSRYYAREAKKAAEDYGIKFDGRDMFVAEVSEGQLAGAFTVVANCSQTAVIASSLKSSERAQRDAGDVLFVRLSRIFPPSTIAKDAPILGASGHEWHVSTMVTEDDRRTVFEAVSHHYPSVVSTAAKFHDLARLERLPSRIAVVSNRMSLGDYIGVLSAASTSVVESSVPDQTFARLAAA